MHHTATLTPTCTQNQQAQISQRPESRSEEGYQGVSGVLPQKRSRRKGNWQNRQHKMGNGKSKLMHVVEQQDTGKAVGASAQTRFFGLANLGNTCYCNAVMQALYACDAFREAVLAWHAAQQPTRSEDLLQCLAELFATMENSSKHTGKLTPSKFIDRLRVDNDLFACRQAQQDAHEFLNFLLNALDDTLEHEKRSASTKSSSTSIDSSFGGDSMASAEDEQQEQQQRSPQTNGDYLSSNGSTPKPHEQYNFVKALFQGKLVNRTKCLWCETVTVREEPFFDLSLDVERNCSLSSCLQHFSKEELLGGSEKFHCDACCGLQEAQRRILIKQAPPILALHLKRFKFYDNGRYRKVTQRVAFPQELKLCNITEDSNAKDMPYDLFAVVVHKGRTLHFGHYISLVRGSNGKWVRFDDDDVDVEDEDAPESVFGTPQEEEPESAADVANGYILLYARRSGADAASLGLRRWYTYALNGYDLSQQQEQRLLQQEGEEEEDNE